MNINDYTNSEIYHSGDPIGKWDINVEGWATMFTPTKRMPVIGNRIFDTKEHMLDYVNGLSSSALPGLYLAVVNDENVSKNGAYFVESCDIDVDHPTGLKVGRVGNVGQISVVQVIYWEGEEGTGIGAGYYEVTDIQHEHNLNSYVDSVGTYLKIVSDDSLAYSKIEIDLSNYYTKQETNIAIDTAISTVHTHPNISVLNRITNERTNSWDDAAENAITGVVVNDKTATVENKIATVTIDGDDINVTYSQQINPTLNNAITDISNRLTNVENHVRIEIVVVDVLPQPPSGETMDKLYLVPKVPSSSPNTKDEYITVRTNTGTTEEPVYVYEWVKIGDTEVDLSGYVEKTRTIAGIDLQNDISTTALKNALDLPSVTLGTNLSEVATAVDHNIELTNAVAKGSVGTVGNNTLASQGYVDYRMQWEVIGNE